MELMMADAETHARDFRAALVARDWTRLALPLSR
jgi:hypothetical protein